MTTTIDCSELRDLIELAKSNFDILTQRQKEDLMSAASQLEDAGDEEGADTIYRLFPLPASFVKGMKDDFGPEFLKRLNFNYTEAENLYGKDWLER